MPPLVTRAALGLLAATAIALAARRVGSLSASGALAAALVGAVAVAAGWRWGALLVLYFVLSSALSHVGGTEKARRTSGIVAKGGARDAMQVLANGGVFALCALGVGLAPAGGAPMLAAAAAGALAAATADTWATEIGTLWGGTPRSPLDFRLMPAGTSGGMSVVGTLASVAGALLIAAVARLLTLTDALAAVAIGGCAGAMADTLAGATVQERRWCDACDRPTERHVHDCGNPTRLAGGFPVVDNDIVNLLGTLTGAALAASLAFMR